MRIKKKNRSLKPFIMENKKSFIIIPLLVIGIVLVVGLVFMFINKDNQYKFEGNITQYYAGQKYTISEEAHLSRALEGVTELAQGGESREVTSQAFYEEDENKIILPVDMAYYDPRNEIIQKIDAFTEITVEDTGVLAVNGKKKCSLNQGFLYDGADYYIFLEDVTAKFNRYEYELSPMSYVEAIFQFQVTAFDYASKEFLMEPTDTEVVVSTESGDYTVNLLSDMYEDELGEKRLLFTRPDLLDSMLE